MSAQLLLATVDAQGQLTGVGRARTIARATVDGGEVVDWQETEVRWDESHEAEVEGNHHASIAKFFLSQHATDLVAAGAGPDMRRMLDRMGVRLILASGKARPTVTTLARFQGRTLPVSP